MEGDKLYYFRSHHTPVPSPKPLGCCSLGEEGVFAGGTRRGEAGPRTKDGPLASTVLHGSGYILLPSFLPFLFFGLAAIVRT